MGHCFSVQTGKTDQTGLIIGLIIFRRYELHFVQRSSKKSGGIGFRVNSLGCTRSHEGIPSCSSCLIRRDGGPKELAAASLILAIDIFTT